MTKFIVALQFLTRIQINPNLVVDDETFGKSMSYFPLVGLIMGLTLAGAYYLLSFIFTPLITAAFIIWLEVAISGGLHLDGFMDTMDGIYSGRSRERILEIMKDSRVGAHSVIAVVCLFLFKLVILTDFSSSSIFFILILTPMLARLTQPIGVTFFPYVRETGLAKTFNTYLDKKDLFKASLISLLVCIGLKGILGVFLFILTWIIALLINRYIASKIGGLTGDVYGAVTELTTVILLIIGYILFDLEAVLVNIS